MEDIEKEETIEKMEEMEDVYRAENKNFIKGLITGVLITAFIACCMVCLSIIKNSSTGVQDPTISRTLDTVSGDSIITARTLSKIQTLEGLIDSYYIDSVSKNDIEEGIYDGIMASLGDPYSCYYSPEELEATVQRTEGFFYGIGAVLILNKDYGYPQVVSLIDDSPAANSELRMDDIITEVDGVDLAGMELEDSVALIKGQENTEVVLHIVRLATSDEFDVHLIRAKVESQSVNYEMLDDGIGYIQIESFEEATVEQFTEALATIKGSRAKGLIIDLRGNPGGSLPAVVDIARELLPEGLVVTTEDKYGNVVPYQCDGAHELDIPLVVLVNGGSASASEILAGAIKDYGVGTIMGTTTYGKGIVQRIIQLNDGSAVKITVSHYYTPLHNDINKVGIEPDVEIEFDVDAYLNDTSCDNQLDAAIQYIKDEM